MAAKSKKHDGVKWLVAYGWPIGLIVLVGWLSYRNSFRAAFHLDDYKWIVSNEALANLGELWRSFSWQTGRRMTALTFALNYHWGGLNVFGYHLFNWGLHVVNAVGVLWLGTSLTQTPRLLKSKLATHGKMVGLVAALVFVAHPIQTGAVTYIVQRMALMVAGCYIVAVGAYVRLRLEMLEWRGKWRWNEWSRVGFYVCLILLAGLVGAYSKMTIATLPVMLAVSEVAFFPIKQWRRKLLMLAGIWGLGMLLVVWFGTRIYSFNYLLATRISIPGEQITSYRYGLTQTAVWLTYMRLLLVPVAQNLDYDYPIMTHWWQGRVLLGMGGILGLVVLTGWLWKKERLASWGLIWIMVTLLVTSSIIPIKDVIFEHRLYLPMVGFSLSLAAVAVRVLGIPSRQPLVLVMGLVIVGYMVLTYQRNKVWQTEITLWSDVVKKSPNKARGYDFLGVGYQLAGDYATASRLHERSLELGPNYAEVHSNLGMALIHLGRPKEAQEELEAAIKLDPKQAPIYNGLGAALQMQGATEAAKLAFEKALALDPTYKGAQENLDKLEAAYK